MTILMTGVVLFWAGFAVGGVCFLGVGKRLGKSDRTLEILEEHWPPHEPNKKARVVNLRIAGRSPNE